MAAKSTICVRITLGQSPDTRRSLLIRVRDTEDHTAWQEFVAIYAPLIHAYAMRRGLQDADAADVAQQVLQSIARAIPGFEYDPKKGTFRGWLFTITRNHLLKSFQQHRRTPTATGDTAFQDTLNQQEDAASDEELWNLEHERQLFQWATEKVRVDFKESTWNAFWGVAVEGKPASEVAETLEMSTGAVYIAKSRVMARLREEIEAIEL